MKMYSKIQIIIRSVLVFFIFYFSSYFQVIPIFLFHLNTNSLSSGAQVFLSTFSSMILFVIFFFVYRKELKKEFHIFINHFIENMDVGVRWWLLGLFIMMISNVTITYFFRGGGANNEQVVQEMVHAVPWIMIISAGIIAPFNEEIVFRKALKDVFHNKWIFSFLSFLLFGGAHVIGNASSLIDYFYIIPYGILGWAFAMAYSETDTIFTSMTMHMIHNTILVLLSIFLLS